MTYAILINLLPKVIRRAIQVQATKLGCKSIDKVIVVWLLTRPRFLEYCVPTLITNAFLKGIINQLQMLFLGKSSIKLVLSLLNGEDAAV